jgi:hypothetical protein
MAVDAPPRPRAPIFGVTIHQPWAWCIVHGPKRIENRTWAPPCPIGSYLAIHAGRECDEDAIRWIEGRFGLVFPQVLPSGAVVGVAKLVTVTECDPDPWFFGPIGWVLGEVAAVDPIPCRGHKKLWTLPPDVLETLRTALRAQRRPASAEGAP